MRAYQYPQLAEPPPAAVEAPEEVTLDKWHRPTSQPVRRRPRAFHPAGDLVAEPLDLAVPTLDRWAQPTAQPVRTRRPRPVDDLGLVTTAHLGLYFPGDGFPWPPASNPLPRKNLFRQRPHDLTDPSWFRSRYYLDARGLYRVFNPAVYRFYRSNTGPPSEDDSPFATNATLPHTPADTHADGTWWLSVSYYNGILDSGFLPVGPAGETYLRLDLAGGEEAETPPAGPLDWRLVQKASGVVRVLAVYYETGANRADAWALAYTVDGSAPPADTPDATETIAAAGLAVLQYDLPGQADGTTVKVRLQTRRDSTYSEDSTVETTTADAAGPAAPPSADRWVGGLPENL